MAYTPVTYEDVSDFMNSLAPNNDGHPRKTPKNCFMHVGVASITRRRAMVPNMSSDKDGPFKIPASYQYCKEVKTPEKIRHRRPS